MALDFSASRAVVFGEGALHAAITARLRAQGATVHAGTDGSALVREAQAAGGFDILVLTIEPTSQVGLLALDDATLDAVLDGALRGAIDTVRAALPALRASGQGRIVACVPSSGVFGADHGVAESIAAAGLTALIRGTAQANLDCDLRANVLSYIAATPGAEGLFDAHPVVQRQLFPVEAVLPAVTYLAHGSCAMNGETISAAAGRFAKLVTSVTLGGFNPALTDDGFADLLPKIVDTRSTFAPRTVIDELITIAV